MLPGPFQVLKSLYWGFRRNPRLIGHRLYVLGHCFLSCIRLWLLRLSHWRQPLVLLSLVESMGDIVAAEPISRAARRQFPNAYIVWIVRPAFVELVECFDAVDEGFPVTCLTEWMLLLGCKPPGTVWEMHVSNATCARCRAPLPKYGDASGITLDTYYDLRNLLTVYCRCAGIPPIDEAPRFDPGPDAGRAVDALALPAYFVVLHCTSNDFNRNWRPEYWDELAAYIEGTLGWSIVEIGLLPVTAGAKSGRYRNLCGNISIPQMAEVIRRAALFIGVDSGPAHFANAVGTPGVLLFGKYGHWQAHMPYSGRYEDGTGADLLRTPGPLAGLAVAAVTQAVDKRIGHAPDAYALTAESR